MMREIREWFAWFYGETGLVEFDLEDLHDLDDLSPVDAVEYVVDYLWHSYNFPSRDGKIYVNDYVDYGDDLTSEGATLRARFVELVGFSTEELEAIQRELSRKDRNGS